MRFVLPEPMGDRLEPVNLAPGVRVQAQRCAPLPSDVATLRKRVMGPRTVINVEQTETESGWPLTLVRTPDALFGFFELFDHCAVVVATAEDMASLDGAFGRVRGLFLAGDIDRRQAEVVALAQLWEGHE